MVFIFILFYQIKTINKNIIVYSIYIKMILLIEIHHLINVLFNYSATAIH
jgi:hypothetical protein